MLQGFLIAFTSEFLPKLVYMYEYDMNLKGYVNFSLSFSPNGTLSRQCRYRGLRDEEGVHRPFFWKLLSIQFAFVIIFEVGLENVHCTIDFFDIIVLEIFFV